MRAVAWLGVPLLLLSVVLQIAFPRAMGPLPAGLHTPVLALEIARSAPELVTMFGPPGSPERARWGIAVDRGNAIDFAFIVVYCAFLIACMRAFLGARPRHARAGAALALLAGGADAIENACLFAITARLGGDYGGPLWGLMIATWTKWLSIAASLAILSPGLYSHGRWGTVAAWIAGAALPVAIGAAVLRGVTAELMLLVISLAFIVAWSVALRAQWRARQLTP
jgi:hypothetical protein